MEILSETLKYTNKLPIGIEVNPEWLDIQVRTGGIVNKKNDGNIDLSLINSVPVYLNKEIHTYKFVYEEE